MKNDPQIIAASTIAATTFVEGLKTPVYLVEAPRNGDEFESC